jgi:putative lipoprotein
MSKLLNTLAAATAVFALNANLAVAATPPSFTGGGNEPFWSIKVTPKQIVFDTLGGKKRVFPYVSPQKAQGRIEDSLRWYKLKGGHTLLIQQTSCNDTMSDNIYEYSVVLHIDNKVLTGCVTKK